MDLLVLDTIHGGEEIARSYRVLGHSVDTLDVYRGSAEDWAAVSGRHHDLIISPVHLDPCHPVLVEHSTSRISHHEAVKQILSGRAPSPMIEITGARGKTTTAFALAHLLPGPGVLHTSAGTMGEPGHRPVFHRSITPASVLPAAAEAVRCGGWLVAEISLGLTGAGDIGIITTSEDYRCAGGKKSALAEKLRSAAGCSRVVLAPGISESLPNATRVQDVVECHGDRCQYDLSGISGGFENPLLLLESYRVPMMCAATAACLLGIDPAPLGLFPPVAGRLSLSREGGRLVVDDSNSGVCAGTAVEAARYARKVSGKDEVILVIGQEGRAVCEGFPGGEISGAISSIGPESVVLIGDEASAVVVSGISGVYADSLDEGRKIALGDPGSGSVVLAVKTWR
ncbi:MAG: coenzyme F430 synthase [Methanoregulaceae archaeon]|nr:coenzyme F430 synthase [Methanoregulaceae archaeon]